ncbi:transcriptional regulator [Ralstonia wenshanensis]|uniref:transcriptional regulator n=1 Tax=Ralstonia wenshanensis TaxID=2842456 RepID=UPI00292F06B1|nr:YdaS family helix-turn-helix protein [Ralstonia wenshanensis]
MAMTLTEYVRARRGRLTALARAIDMSPIYLSQVVNKGLRINPARCVAIEVATQGAVRRPDLRPDDWHLIWPELVSVRAPSTRLHHRPMRPKPPMIPAAASAARLRRIRRVSRARGACSPTRAFSRQLLCAGSSLPSDEASVRARQNRR